MPSPPPSTPPRITKRPKTKKVAAAVASSFWRYAPSWAR